MAKSIVGQRKTIEKQRDRPERSVEIVLPRNDLTRRVTRQYCERNLMGEWFADDVNDEESLGDCYH